MFSLHPPQQLHTAAVRQAQVCQDKIELLSLKFLTGRRECSHMSGCHTLFLQPVTDTATEDNIILYNQYIFHLLILYSSSYFQHRQLVSQQLLLLYRYTLSVLPSRVPGGGASILKRHVTPQDGLCRQIYLTDVHANASGYERIVGQMCAK
jgi:hypothetical protein